MGLSSFHSEFTVLPGCVVTTSLSCPDVEPLFSTPNVPGTFNHSMNQHHQGRCSSGHQDSNKTGPTRELSLYLQLMLKTASICGSSLSVIVLCGSY
jgi:hypothetical protein